jgi:hypothetical protein
MALDRRHAAICARATASRLPCVAERGQTCPRQQAEICRRARWIEAPPAGAEHPSPGLDIGATHVIRPPIEEERDAAPRSCWSPRI